MPAGAVRIATPRPAPAIRSPASDALKVAPVVGVERDGHGEPVARRGHGELVAAVHAVERRDVHLLGGPGPALRVGVDEVGVAVAVGVVHLHDRGRGSPVAVEAPEDADRVEAVPERARVRGHQDAARPGGRGQVDAVPGQVRRHVAAEGRVRPAEVVACLEPRQAPVVGQVVEVDQPGVRAVGEGPLPRLAAGVGDGGPVDRRCWLQGWTRGSADGRPRTGQPPNAIGG